MSKLTQPYFTGPRLLVAPVGVMGATTRDVYLPKLSESQNDMTWKHWFVLVPMTFGSCDLISSGVFKGGRIGISEKGAKLSLLMLH